MSKTSAAILACLFNHALLGSLTAADADDNGKQPESPSQIQRIGNSSVQVELRETTDSATFAVLGLSKLELLQKLPPEDLQKSLTIRVHQPGNTSNLPALLGTHSVTNTELRFASRFPLSHNVQYRIELDPLLLDGPYDLQGLVFSVRQKKHAAAAAVSAVYPSADVLPENLLKFYIHFSAPMSRGEAYERVHLMHDGALVESPFLELGEELWDTDQTRFTLFLHPGRIKRGLKPREDSGTPITEGKDYALHIDADWLSADLQPLAAQFVKKFRVVGADALQPDPKKWKLVAPKANSKQPVTLIFDEPLDHAMLNRVVRIQDASKAEVPGSVTVKKNETIWSFEPTDPWKLGRYSIGLATNLEDLVGNSLARPFETKEQKTEPLLKIDSEMAIEFVIP